MLEGKLTMEVAGEVNRKKKTKKKHRRWGNLQKTDCSVNQPTAWLTDYMFQLL